MRDERLALIHLPSTLDPHPSSLLMHSIRLREPWESEPVDGAAGRVRLGRRFGRPTGLGPSDVVWLVVEGTAPYGSVSLNGSLLGEAPGRFDVTAELAERNRVTIEVDLPTAGPPLGEVRLEIDAAGP